MLTFPDNPGRSHCTVRRPFMRLMPVLAAVALSSCRSADPSPVTRPTEHAVEADQLRVFSDFELSADHSLIRDLVELRGRIIGDLDLPESGTRVVVYLFDTEAEYRRYLRATYPGLPERRAYFVGTADELAVYTFWGERIREDLRHEYTHGLLHAALKSVPLWLDEGLAEYYEVGGADPEAVNPEYARGLDESLAQGWQPDLRRLERLEKFSQMQWLDYQEAWAWVHFFLHSTPEAREALLAYLKDLRTESEPQRLSERLRDDQAEYADRLLDHLASLRIPGAQLGALSPGSSGKTPSERRLLRSSAWMREAVSPPPSSRNSGG